MDSLWTKTAARPAFERLEGDARTDALVIGGGMAGILCAYMLRRAGVDCMLIEAERICGGVTAGTTAKLTLQHGLFCDKMLRRFGTERTAAYIRAQQRAIEEYRRLCEAVPCDFKERPSVVYSRTDRERIEREVRALERVGVFAEFTAETCLPFAVTGAVRVEGQAQLHPLKLAFALAQELPIYEHTRALEWRPDGVITDRGRIRAERVVVATHFPFLRWRGGFFLKMYQHRSYVLGLENAPKMDGMYVDEDSGGLSFRGCGELLLLGGGAHRTGKRGGGWRELEAFAGMRYPDARVVERWATQDCMTLDALPYIGQYSRKTPQLYVATGFQKWGMSTSMLSAMLLTELLQGRRSELSELLSPSRSIWRPQLIGNIGHAALGLLTPTAPRCPHLGCALKYNRQEHSWDCSCHGSRFSETGEVLDNPANGDK